MVVKSVEELTVEDIRVARRAIEYYYEQGWTDGLPVVPPIQEFVDEFLAQTDRGADEVLVTVDHLKRSCTVRQAAINAVMAGCRPEYFPVVVAMVEALQGAGGPMMQSTTGQAPIVIVNGPARERLGFNSKENIYRSFRIYCDKLRRRNALCDKNSLLHKILDIVIRLRICCS